MHSLILLYTQDIPSFYEAKAALIISFMVIILI